MIPIPHASADGPLEGFRARAIKAIKGHAHPAELVTLQPLGGCMNWLCIHSTFGREEHLHGMCSFRRLAWPFINGPTGLTMASTCRLGPLWQGVDEAPMFGKPRG